MSLAQGALRGVGGGWVQELLNYDKFTIPPFYEGLEEDPLTLSVRGSHSDAEFAFIPGQKAVEQVCW